MKNGKEPIYPIGEEEKDRLDTYPDISYKGLTKREYFAAMAMQGFLTQSAHLDRIISEMSGVMANNIAEASCKIADALLSELEKTNQP